MMKQAIDVLKSKISSNLEEIRINEQKFRKIMSHGDINDSSEEMNLILEENKSLLSENFDFLNLQLSMIKFLEKYKRHKNYSNSIDFDEIDSIHESLDIFYFTTEGSLAFNLNHPMIYDEFFWGELMHYYNDNLYKEKSNQVLNALMLSRLN